MMGRRHPTRAAISLMSSSGEAKNPMRVLHELLKESLRHRLLMDDRLVGHPRASRLRSGPGPLVVGRRPGADLGGAP
jgi:hypothetical protein